MKAERNSKKLDELICRAIGRDKPQFDFDKWKQNHEEEIDIFESQEKSKKVNSSTLEPSIWRIKLWRRVGYLAAAFLIISSLAACFVLSGKVTELQNELELAGRDIARTDDSATINLYLREHQDFIARTASLKPSAPQPAQMRLSQDDILYYEFLDDGPEFMRPGMIVRGPSSPRQIGPSEAPAISNGHTLTLAEARETADFPLVSPSWLNPGYALDQIRRIEGRDALQLLYTDGINSISLFEQPLDGQRGLSRQDFREYAVYQNAEQAGGTILAWRDDTLSYVLIGNAELSQLMNMAQSISAGR
jgi:hypothetical protein